MIYYCINCGKPVPKSKRRFRNKYRRWPRNEDEGHWSPLGYCENCNYDRPSLISCAILLSIQKENYSGFNNTFAKQLAFIQGRKLMRKIEVACNICEKRFTCYTGYKVSLRWRAIYGEF